MTKKIPATDDSDLFRQAIGKVRPVNNDKVLLQKQNKPKPVPRQASVNFEEHLIDKETGGINKVSPEDTLAYTAPGLQKNVLKKLRKGQYGLDAEIDLHGLSSREAKRQLLSFLHHAVVDGHRCVHIVHGKGHRSADNHPVLKNSLNVWLRQHQNILAFCSAPLKGGGAGAVYVLLKLPGIDK